MADQLIYNKGNGYLISVGAMRCLLCPGLKGKWHRPFLLLLPPLVMKRYVAVAFISYLYHIHPHYTSTIIRCGYAAGTEIFEGCRRDFSRFIQRELALSGKNLLPAQQERRC